MAKLARFCAEMYDRVVGAKIIRKTSKGDNGGLCLVMKTHHGNLRVMTYVDNGVDHILLRLEPNDVLPNSNTHRVETLYQGRADAFFGGADYIKGDPKLWDAAAKAGKAWALPDKVEA